MNDRFLTVPSFDFGLARADAQNASADRTWSMTAAQAANNPAT
jgi:hypothetical protein